MLLTMLVLALAATAVMWLQPPAKPQPVRARRNLSHDELLAGYISQEDTNRRW